MGVYCRCDHSVFVAVGMGNCGGWYGKFISDLCKIINCCIFAVRIVACWALEKVGGGGQVRVGGCVLRDWATVG